MLMLIGSHSLVMLICQVSTHAPLDKDIIAAILATNASESSEFIRSYVNQDVVLALCGLATCLLLFVTLRHKLRLKTPPKAVGITSLAVLIISGALTFHNPAVMQETALGFIRTAMEISRMSQIKILRHNPKVEIITDRQPPLIIWCIGEALTNHHCSLYGYRKETNPLLREMANQGKVLVFRNTQSAGTKTLESFELMMSTYEKAMGNKVKWNECVTLPDIAHAAGYHTSWLSNQSKKGLYDNVVGQYSELCDTSVFIGNQYAGLQRTSYDIDLLPVLKSMMSHPTGKDLHIIHLMGCHQDFKMRYPETFSHFTESDYADKPANQRYRTATYDNAVLYNDYVVSSLFKLVSQKEAIVIYAPDHGLDIYESRPDFAGHVSTNNSIGLKAAHDIPFLVFMTDSFRKNNPDITDRLSKSTEKAFNTEDIIYLLMDIMQCDFRNHLVKQKSIARI